jgi:endonuclease YncB( thermonuclease family)
MHERLLCGAIAALAFLWTPAAAQVTDGDTLKQGGITYRLWGIDAPEAKQVCPDGWPAGSLAATRLQALTAGRSIVCQEKDRDRFGWMVAICRASGEDLRNLKGTRRFSFLVPSVLLGGQLDAFEVCEV